jgi:hypothetical protein
VPVCRRPLLEVVLARKANHFAVDGWWTRR